MLDEIFAAARVGLALGVPFILWPWATARVFYRLEFPGARLLGAASGPLWFGWLLGILLLALPGQSVWLYALVLVTAPLMLWRLGRPRLSEASAPAAGWSKLALAGATVIVVLMTFTALAFPPNDHDVLIIDLFARQLSATWDYWGLPRYAPNSRGFYYPLSHPPGMMGMLAWLYAFSDWGWVLRFPSAYFLAAFIASLAAAAARLVKGSAPLTVALIASASLFVHFLTGNSQDIFRYAAFSSALLAFSAVTPRRQSALIVGALLGLSAAYHSLQAVFVVLVPMGWWFANRFKVAALRQTVAMLAAGVLFGAYPYVSNYIHLGKLLIPTSSVHDIPLVSRYLREVMSTYADVDPEWSLVSLSRLKVLLPAQSGYIGWGFVAAVLALVLSRPLRFVSTASRTVLWAMAISSIGFLILVLDPGNFVLRFAKTTFWSNVRYAHTVLPLQIVVVAAVAGGLLMALGRWRDLGVLVISLAIGAVASPRLGWDTKQAAERGASCVWCGDSEKRAANRGTGMFRAVRWLESAGPVQCLTFREAEYFAFSTSLSGTPYYSPLAERALGQQNVEEAKRVLSESGINCVVVAANGPMRDALERNAPVFSALVTHPTVTPISFYDVEVWMFDAVTAVSPIEAAVTQAAGQLAETPLPGAGWYAFSMTYAASGPLNVVGWVGAEHRSTRVFLRNQVEPGNLAFAFAASQPADRLHFWFSRPVSVESVALRALHPAK